MPRTTGPLTVEYDPANVRWIVREGKRMVAICYKEAHARAFVALPALIDAVTAAIVFIQSDAYHRSEGRARVQQQLVAALALAAADGPVGEKA